MLAWSVEGVDIRNVCAGATVGTTIFGPVRQPNTKSSAINRSPVEARFLETKVSIKFLHWSLRSRHLRNEIQPKVIILPNTPLKIQAGHRSA
jgi:hypothetical protein